MFVARREVYRRRHLANMLDVVRIWRTARPETAEKQNVKSKKVDML